MVGRRCQVWRHSLPASFCRWCCPISPLTFQPSLTATTTKGKYADLRGLVDLYFSVCRSRLPNLLPWDSEEDSDVQKTFREEPPSFTLRGSSGGVLGIWWGRFIPGISGSPSERETLWLAHNSPVGLHFPVITGMSGCSLEELELVARERMVWDSPLMGGENEHSHTYIMLIVLIYVICFSSCNEQYQQ